MYLELPKKHLARQLWMDDTQGCVLTTLKKKSCYKLGFFLVVQRQQMAIRIEKTKDRGTAI